jgi:uncharacterized hydantoinase/oxoprolinase family protein
MSDISEFALPSNPDDLSKIKNAIIEISAQKQMMKDRAQGIKDIKDDLKESFEMPVALVNKLVNALDDSKYQEMAAENSMFELVRESIMGDGGLSDDSEV